VGRKSRISKEQKISACVEYKRGIKSASQITSDLNIGHKTIYVWYKLYLEYGNSAFDEKKYNRSYSNEFKQQIVSQYYREQLSLEDIAVKNNISRSVVSGWIKKYNSGEQLEDYNPLPEVYTMANRKTTTKERIEIVKYVLANSKDYKIAASKYQVKYSTIYSWVKKYLEQGESGLVPSKRGPKQKTHIVLEDLSEVERLKYLYEEEKRKRELAEFTLEAYKKKEELEEKLYRK